MRQVYLSCAAWQRTKLCSFGAGGRARRGLRSGVAVLRQLPVPRSEHLLLRRRCSESDGGAGSSILMAEYRSPIDRGGGGGGRLRCIARGVSLPPRTGLLRFSRPAVGRPAPRRKHPASAASRLQPPPPPPSLSPCRLTFALPEYPYTPQQSLVARMSAILHSVARVWSWDSERLCYCTTHAFKVQG